MKQHIIDKFGLVLTNFPIGRSFEYDVKMYKDEHGYIFFKGNFHGYPTLYTVTILFPDHKNHMIVSEEVLEEPIDIFWNLIATLC